MSYIGLPYKDGGRDRKGIDCWGLVCLVHLEEAKIELPSYGWISAENLLGIARQMKKDVQMDPWRDVAAAPRRRFDVVVMRTLAEVSRVPVHVGIMLNDKMMLHTVKPVDSHQLPLNHPSVRTRIIGYYRHMDLL